jgi:hypothetical protein
VAYLSTEKQKPGVLIGGSGLLYRANNLIGIALLRRAIGDDIEAGMFRRAFLRFIRADRCDADYAMRGSARQVSPQWDRS